MSKTEERITTESIVNDLRVMARYPRNLHVPYICRLAAERLEELEKENERRAREIFAEIETSLHYTKPINGEIHLIIRETDYKEYNKKFAEEVK